MSQKEASREDKRLPASERKLRNARSEGQVARSRDAGHALLLAATFGVFAILAARMGQQGVEILRAGLDFDAGFPTHPEAMMERLAELGWHGLMMCLPVAIAGLLAGVVAAAVPGGVLLTSKPLAPKWERISPLAGIKRQFSRNHMIDSAKLAAIVCLLTVVAAWFAWASLARFVNLVQVPLMAALQDAGNLIGAGSAALLVLLLVIGAIDGPYQWFRHRNDLKMTLQEAREELKETDGDPHLRARIRARQREIGSRRMMAQVPSADVVITNPTHYSVALRYQDGEMGAPRVVAKGTDQLALRIREVAREAGVPLFEAPPLARALHAHVPLDREIPGELYGAVAQVLAYVFQLREAARGRAASPRPPTGLEVPAGLDPQAEGSRGLS